jgi:hypothetical protein
MIPLHHFRQFCLDVTSLEVFPQNIRHHYQPDACERLRAAFEQHLREGYKRWDTRGTRDEAYAQRAVDALSGARPDIHVLEGCTIRNGSGFRHGRDLLANYVIFGLNPVPVDAVGAWIMGHDPRHIGVCRVARERGKGEIDPSKIETFMVRHGGFDAVDYRDLERIRAGVYHYSGNRRLLFY